MHSSLAEHFGSFHVVAVVNDAAVNTGVYISFQISALKKKKKNIAGTSLVVQWLRLCTPKTRGLGSITGWRTRSHMLQIRLHVPQLRPGAAK